MTEDEQKAIRDDITGLVPKELFKNIRDVDCELVAFIVRLGRECLNTGAHNLFNSSGGIISGYWKDFVDSFLGTSSWFYADGFVLEELTKVFDLYCDNHDISLLDNDFVNFILDKAKEADVNPIMNKVRNGFTVGNREATVGEFIIFAPYFPKLNNDIPNKETFVQNFIEKAFVTNQSCRMLILNYSSYYMPLINQSYQIAQRIVRYIDEHKDSEETCAKLYAMLFEEVIDSLNPKGKDEK